MKEVVTDTRPADMWWLGVIYGIVTLIFGIAALFWPGLTLVTLVYIFSAYILVWGVIEIVRSLTNMNGAFGSWWLTLIFGVLCVGVGVYLVRHPAVSFETFILLIGFTFVVRGIFDIVGALFDGDTATSKTLSIIGGILGLIVGVIILRQPVAGGVAFVWLIGFYALLFGPLTIALSLDVHKHGGELTA